MSLRSSGLRLMTVAIQRQRETVDCAKLPDWVYWTGAVRRIGREILGSPVQHKRCHVLGIALSTFLLGAWGYPVAASAQGGPDSVWPTREWKTSTAEQQGMDSAALAGLIEFGTKHRLDSLLIARHGTIVLDAYYAPNTAHDPHAMHSATKAVIGTLIGIAQKDGLLVSTDHRMLEFFGDRSIANVDDKKKAITVANLKGLCRRTPPGKICSPPPS
jgi:Beta-lactamase